MSILKLTPSCKDYLWGGSRLRTDFGVQSDLNPLAEAWVLSCHPDGPSYLPDGTMLADYLAALDLDETLDDVYYKAAEVCLALGDTEAARDILRRGYDATGDEGMLTWAEELDGNGQERSETVTMTGVVIRNVDYYGAQWERYRDTYQTSPTSVCTMDTYGVRFPQPVTVTLGDETVTIAEAGIEGENYDDINQLAGQNVSLTGYFYRNVETEELNTIRLQPASAMT